MMLVVDSEKVKELQAHLAIALGEIDALRREAIGCDALLEGFCYAKRICPPAIGRRFRDRLAYVLREAAGGEFEVKT